MKPKHSSGRAWVTFCYVFAVINTVFCSVCVVVSLAFLGLVLARWFVGESRSANEMVSGWLFLGISLACTVGSIVAVVFALLLWIGLEKNKPGYIKWYVLYGVVIVVLSVAESVRFICMEWGNTLTVNYASIPLVICVLYSGVLVLLCRTRTVLAARAPPALHKTLLSNDHC